jgi:hypothetical protein
MKINKIVNGHKWEIIAEKSAGNRSYVIIVAGVETAHGSSGAGAYGTPGSLWAHYGSAEDGGLTDEEYSLFCQIDWTKVEEAA